MTKYLLKVDIDGKLEQKKIIDRMNFLRRVLKFQFISILKNKTSHGHHLRICFETAKELDDKDMVFFQLFLLSDYRREGFNWFRVFSGCKEFNALFMQKFNSKGKLISYER